MTKIDTKKLTVKQETFCQKYIELGDASAAYRASYSCEKMKPATINRKAKELMDNGKITARISELQEHHAKRHDITVDTMTEKLLAAYELSFKVEAPAAAVSAVREIGKLHGIYPGEKHKHEHDHNHEHSGQVSHEHRGLSETAAFIESTFNGRSSKPLPKLM